MSTRRLLYIPDGAGGALQAPTHVRFKTVAAGWGFSVGLATNGTLWGWGTPFKSPFAANGWTFASQDWTRYRGTEHYYVPHQRFKAIAAAAFHIMAITAGRGPWAICEASRGVAWATCRPSWLHNHG